MKEFIETLELYFGKKAPQLPTNVKEIIVKFAPYLAILGVVAAIPAVLNLVGFGGTFGAMMPYSRYTMGYGGFGIAAIFSIVGLVLNALAISGLFKRTASGWNYSFYSVLVGAVQNILMMNIIGLIISFAIGCYILFQIRAYYFGGATMTSEAPMQGSK